MGELGTPTKIEVGQCYFFRTMTDHYVGRVKAIVGPKTVELTEAAWIADSGLLSTFVREGKAKGMEVEYLGDMHELVYRDRIPWPHGPFTKDYPSAEEE